MSPARTPQEEAVFNQRLAADPVAHAFVSANAGSGKTRVLVDRVIRHLLAGSTPDRILCLTYTKAAASEMQARLFKRLGQWSILEDGPLAKELADLDGGAGAHDLRRARALFAQALETPGGLKIQTIHAFCERLLRRFPLEAGVSPGFEILDDVETRRLAERARAAVADAALSNPKGPEAGAFAALAARVADDDADKMLAWAADRRERLRQAFHGRDASAIAGELRARLGVAEGLDEAGVHEAAWKDAPRGDLKAAAQALRTSDKKSDLALADGVAAALAAKDAGDAHAAYAKALFTGAGTVRARLVTKDTLAAHPLLDRLFGAPGEECRRMEAARDLARAVCVAAVTEAALTLAQAYIAAYEREKVRVAGLDFADLIAKARGLLVDAGAAPWVLYKLDGGVDHILVDEAQDTAPDQWDVITAIAEEFAAGQGASERPRTVFAVGDEKQSIYSFQGARPEKFLEVRQSFGEAAPARTKTPDLLVSFRSAPAILLAVDDVFADEELARRLTPRGVVPAHIARRDDVVGLVELWPAAPQPEKAPEGDLWEPVDAPAKENARQRVAVAVAAAVKGWIDAGESVSEEKGDTRVARAMTAGDVMILVRKRGPLFEELLKRLKEKGVPVAGADRMTLKDQLAVEDLIGAARAGLLPEDDLALAELLKSPFLGLDEDALYRLARPGGEARRGRLLDALRSNDEPAFAEARTLVERLIADAGALTPYAFLAGLLERPSATGESYARRLYARLGPEAEDPVDELLSRALAHEARGAPSLERFVRETMADGGEVKREGTEEGGAVRVMTVHGAKGLEAPVVILPDATEPSGGRREIGVLEDGATGFLWSPRAAEDPPSVEAMREKEKADQAREDLRLLYVAMTRACDRLVVCGAEPGRGKTDETWASLVRAGLERAGAVAVETPFGEGLRLGAPTASVAADKRAAPVAPAIPAWATTPAPAVARATRLVAPARLVEPEGAEPAALSPLERGRPDRFRRGVLVHRLLELLPDLPEKDRAKAAERMLTAEGDLEAKAVKAIAKETLAVLNAPELQPLFGPGSRAEAPLMGTAPELPDGIVIHGRVDRLVVTAKTVIVADYKTNRPPPERAEDVSEAYLAQMAAYRALLRAAYPGREVKCALVWTDGPRIMTLSDVLLDVSLARLTPEGRLHT